MLAQSRMYPGAFFHDVCVLFYPNLMDNTGLELLTHNLSTCRAINIPSTLCKFPILHFLTNCVDMINKTHLLLKIWVKGVT